MHNNTIKYNNNPIFFLLPEDNVIRYKICYLDGLALLYSNKKIIR